MGAACLAAADKFSFLNPQVLVTTALLAGALILGAAVLALIDRWRKRQTNETLATHDQLASFRLLYERGELSHDEFERIRQQLLVRLKTGPAPAPPPIRPAAKP